MFSKIEVVYTPFLKSFFSKPKVSNWAYHPPSLNLVLIIINSMPSSGFTSLLNFFGPPTSTYEPPSPSDSTSPTDLTEVYSSPYSKRPHHAVQVSQRLKEIPRCDRRGS